MEAAIKNLITGTYVTAIDWDNDSLVWGYTNALRFGSKADAEVVNREYGGIGWVVPAPRTLVELSEAGEL